MEPKAVLLRLEPELVMKLDHITVDYDLYRTDLIEMILEDAMDRYDKGDLDIQALAREFVEDQDRQAET